MDHQRGRSPSGGQHQGHLNQTQSPSPHTYQENYNPNGLNIDPALSNDNQQFIGNFPAYHHNNSYLDSQQSHQFSQSNLDDPVFTSSQEFGLQPDFNQQFKQENQPLIGYGQQQHSFSQDLLNTNNFNEGDFSLYSTPATQSEQFDPAFFLNDPSQQSTAQSVNPAELMSDMSSSLANAPTPPQLLHPDGQQPSSVQHSPSFNHHQFQHSPGHSRHVSLGPESAAFPQVHAEWSMMPPQFTNHRKSPSEYSDVSVSSVTPSPHLPHHESFDHTDQRHSPMVHPQDPNLYHETLGIGNFSLSDPLTQHGVSPRHGMSPAHTPAASPRLGPQQVSTTQQSPFMLSMGMSNIGLQSNGFEPSPTGEMYDGQGYRSGSIEMGQAQQMVPPEINVEFAPASRQNSFEPPKPSIDQDALTPPDRGRRRRAVSDPYNPASTFSLSTSPSSISPGIGSDLGSLSPNPARSLSPLDRSATSSPSNRRRQSTSSLPNRDYILGLADPEYQAVSGSTENGNTKRVQKHPATFQCTLCPKRFTRAYNLRSHLRTHTDERPFVCTVCGKAFARQHDRKRHEGLHSGEKKFVCKGELKQGGQWGCGRRFARADALGRHFRSEAGRICIKPLLDEEAIERQRIWQEQQLQNMAHTMQQPQPITVDANGFPLDASGNYTLPAALLAQYPALATLSWSDLPQGDAGMEDDISGRSSFDASGSEYYDEGDEAGYVSGPGTGYGQGQINEGYGGVDYTSDYGGR